MSGPETPPGVIRFHGTRAEYGYLSNFWPAPITLGGRVWPTSEHYRRTRLSAPAFRHGVKAGSPDEEDLRDGHGRNRLGALLTLVLEELRASGG